jgi:hypothetical protein
MKKDGIYNIYIDKLIYEFNTEPKTEDDKYFLMLYHKYFDNYDN